MDSVVYLDAKAKELDNLKSGNKTMIVRGAMGRKIPYGKVNPDDVLYFIENNGDGLIKAKARVSDVFNSEKLTIEESTKLMADNQSAHLLSGAVYKRFAGKRYLVLISIVDFEEVEPFTLDKTRFSNMDDWLPVERIESVM